MKKILSLVLAFTMVLCLGSCAGNENLTAKEVSNAFDGCSGTLSLETSGNSVTSFTYVVEDIYASDLVDKDFSINAMNTVASGDTGSITRNQLKVCEAILAMISVEALLGDEDSSFSSDDLLEKVLGVICDGNTAKYEGWSVSAEVDQAYDLITITAVAE